MDKSPLRRLMEPWRLLPVLTTTTSPDLDEQLGKLIDKLRRRGVLERTWLIVVSDHGESFGEHSGIFCHGSSLYQTELHVPLLIVPLAGKAARQVVKEAGQSARPGSDDRRHHRSVYWLAVSGAIHWLVSGTGHPTVTAPAIIRRSRAGRGGAQPERTRQSRFLRCIPTNLAAGSDERCRVVLHPP